MDNTTDFKYRVAQVLSNEYRQFDTVPVCDTPELVRSVGFSNGEIHMEQNHVRSCLAPEDAKKHRHDLPIDFMDNLPSYIENPAMILQSMTRSDSIVLVTDCKDKKDCPIIISIASKGNGVVKGSVINCCTVTSTYGKDGFGHFLKNSLKSNGLLYCDIKKSRDLVASIGLQLPEFLTKCDSNVIIRRYNENVNTFKQKFLLNDKNYLPEQYGQTLCRPDDGQPFAYVDSDGRQRLTEYGKRADGTSYVSKTTTTFSDGRTEITEYDGNGKVTFLERMTADGRETYSYSSDGYFHSSERSTEYSDVADYFARKSVHEKTRDKKEERGYYYDSTKESWEGFDERRNVILSKHNVYGDGERLRSSSEVRYTYDRHGNETSAIYDDGSVYKTDYYPPSEVRDYYGLDKEDYAMLEISVRDKVKTKTARYPDGHINIKAYTLDGNYTESDYSPDGKLTAFRAENGETFKGKAAELALLRSSGQAPTSADVAATKARRQPQASAKSTKSSKGKPSGKGNGGRGSSGAGR